MKTIELKKEKIYYGTLLLVKAHYPLRSNNMKSLVPADDDKTRIDIPEQCVYQISGNDIDRFIVTVWRKNYD